jgi:hypothetical protein
LTEEAPGFTQFLATHTTEETGFFAVFRWCIDILGKNPVSGHASQLKKPGFPQFFGGVSTFSEKTRFLATPKIAKIEQRPNQKGDYCERFHHRTDIEIGIWARR